MKTKFDLDKLLLKPTALFEKYHQKSKILTLSKDNLDPAKWPKEWKTVRYKGYGRLQEIILPQPQTFIDKPFSAVLSQRNSGRKFSANPIKLSNLSSLLYYSAGINKSDPKNENNRFYPSAGARYPLEVYLIAQNIKNLPKGLYHYYLKNHSLEKLFTFDKFDTGKYFNQDWIKSAPIIILTTAVFKRTTIKYGDRGYRHILQESGHLGQNIYLLSSILDLSCCAIGGYMDDKLNKLLDIDGLNEAVIYVLAIGTT